MRNTVIIRCLINTMNTLDLLVLTASKIEASRVIRLQANIISYESLEWSHNGRNGVSNHQPHQCLFNRLFVKENIKAPRHWPLCGECYWPFVRGIPAQMASNAENVSIWWRHSCNGHSTLNFFSNTLLTPLPKLVLAHCHPVRKRNKIYQTRTKIERSLDLHIPLFM